jgi:chromosome transmission fidelity protein 18
MISESEYWPQTRRHVPTVTRFDATPCAFTTFSAHLLTSMGDTFVTTGLLGKGPSTLLFDSSPTDGLSSGFVSNGLLGGLGTVPALGEPEGQGLAVQEIERVDGHDEPVQAQQKNSFQPNGLLGLQDADVPEQAEHKNSFQPNGLLGSWDADAGIAPVGPLISSLQARADTFASSGMLCESQGRAFGSCAC